MDKFKKLKLMKFLLWAGLIIVLILDKKYTIENTLTIALLFMILIATIDKNIEKYLLKRAK
ncbi:hypothetical protein [Clostridium sp. Ade.TY]|uniref:hypothetical protein n=1 Tax=Clostridium sp. Ade.TY TaxID=1391647 RepID=UPI00041F4A6B|nr:hypothetical protein [Clostridium sp. Ade.TY]